MEFCEQSNYSQIQPTSDESELSRAATKTARKIP